MPNSKRFVLVFGLILVAALLFAGVQSGLGNGVINLGTAFQTAYYTGAGYIIGGGGPGTAGQVWTSNGAGMAPSFQAGGGGGGNPITICASSNIQAPTNSDNANVPLANCAMPALGAGDYIHIDAEWQHAGGTTTVPFVSLVLGPTLVTEAASPGLVASDTYFHTQWDIAILTTSTQTIFGFFWGVNGLIAIDNTATNNPNTTSAVNLGSTFTLSLQGGMSGATSETIAVKGYTVTRWPNL